MVACPMIFMVIGSTVKVKNHQNKKILYYRMDLSYNHVGTVFSVIGKCVL